MENYCDGDVMVIRNKELDLNIYGNISGEFREFKW